jgi:hypothetical protein
MPSRCLVSRPRRCLRATLLLIPAFVSLTTGASAASPVALEYSAPNSCPGQSQFVAAVTARDGNFERSDSASPSAIRIEIHREGERFSGVLEVQTRTGTSARRQVQADDCAEVVAGLAVVTAIALREDTTPPASVASAGESASEPEPPPAPATVAARPTAPAPAPKKDTRLHTLGVWDSESSVKVDAGELGVNHERALTLSAGATFGAIPGLVLPRYELTFSLASFITTPASERYLIGSLPRVRVSLLGKSTLHGAGFDSSVAGFLAGAGTCASIWYDLEGLVLLGCADFAVGVMQVETTDATGAVTQTKSVGQGSAGIELAARYNFGRLLHASLVVGSEAWMSKLSAERPDGSSLFESRVLNGRAQLGLGFNF